MTFRSSLPPVPPVTAPPSGRVDDANIPPLGNPDGLSTLDYCARLPKRRHAHAAKGKLLFFPRTELAMVPYEERGNGWWACVVVLGNGTYTADGYSLQVGSGEIETAIEVPVDGLATLALGDRAR